LPGCSFDNDALDIDINVLDEFINDSIANNGSSIPLV
jgi:hypothetical protein